MNIHSVVWFQLTKVRVTSFSEQFVPIAGPSAARSGSCGRSSTSASIGWCPWASTMFRRALKEFVDHYHRERNHQELANRRIDGSAAGPLGRPLGHYAPAKTLNYARRRSEARNRAVSASQSPISVSCMSE